MSSSVGLTRRLQLLLTRLYIRLLRRAEPGQAKEIETPKETVEVYTFEKEGAELAQVTLTGMIIWNEAQTGGLSEHSHHFIISHESSHKNRHPVWKGLLYGMAILLAVACVLILKSVGIILLGAPLNVLIYPGLVAGSIAAIFLVVYRIEETVADYHALQEMGEEQFSEAYQEIFADSSNSVLGQVQRKILYTHPKHTIKLNRVIEEYRPN